MEFLIWHSVKYFGMTFIGHVTFTVQCSYQVCGISRKRSGNSLLATLQADRTLYNIYSTVPSYKNWLKAFFHSKIDLCGHHFERSLPSCVLILCGSETFLTLGQKDD